MLNKITELAKKHPNDADFGAAVRELLLTAKKQYHLKKKLNQINNKS